MERNEARSDVGIPKEVLVEWLRNLQRIADKLKCDIDLLLKEVDDCDGDSSCSTCCSVCHSTREGWGE